MFGTSTRYAKITLLTPISFSQGSAYSVKDGATGDMSMYGSSLGASPAGYYPYDPTFAAYG